MSDPLIDSFFNAYDGQSVEAVFHPQEGDARPIRVIFDRTGAQMEIGNVTVENPKPQAICRTIDIPDVTHGCTMTIGGTDYAIDVVEDDGTGMTTLMLSLLNQ